MEPKIKSAFEKELANSLNNKKKVVAFVLIALTIGGVTGYFVGYGVGYAKGTYDTLKWGIGTARNFMNITIDDDRLIQAINTRINLGSSAI